ncbi:hypothetical protein Pth03_74310 [Planotetraspora thailandica]|uniref:Uncharacterized protein n=1 Tax=Planotetraspora thailandica TaxID=487172 RepID=A0A8J4DFL5_9ACTN|nr:hypothetical protein [Planotetraspora thailandica]GII59042.1 hypothetical protein Pth03_74310 [Planotetraspora thailandica]
MNIEDLLRETFSEMAAEEPPPAPERFLPHHRARPRRRWFALAAAAAVAVSVAGTAVLVHTLRPHLTPSPTTSVQSTVPPNRTPDAPAPASPAPPLGKMWPDAVHTAPMTLPNHQTFRPEVFLDGHTILARAGKGNSASRPVYWSYDLESRKARKLVDFVPPPKTDFTSPVVAGEGHLVWWTVSWGQVMGELAIWTAPATGGVARKVTSFPQTMKYGDIDYIAVTGGRVVWSRGIQGGVYEAPLSGAEPRMLPGTTDFHLIQWPWASPPQVSGDPTEQADARRIVNVLTEEVRDAVTQPGERVSCAVTWCLSQLGVRHRDGSGARALPGSVLSGIALDRFVVLREKHAGGEFREVLYDLSTGRAGDLGFRGKPGSRESAKFYEAIWVDYSSPALFSYELAGKRIIVDLATIS